MDKFWRNWSGTIRFSPQSIEFPENENEVANIVSKALKEKKNLRPVGQGHSSSPLVETEGILLSLDRYSLKAKVDRKENRATLGAGTTLNDSGKLLLQNGLSMENYGDVAYQALAGAFGTGTHGSGKFLKNLSYQLSSVRMVTGEGDITDIDFTADKDSIRALRVSLGTLGVITECTLNLAEAFRVVRRYWCTHIESCLESLDELIDKNRSFDFYWYPRSDLAQIRTLTLQEDGVPSGTADSVLKKEKTGWASEIIPHERTLKYHEMEYAFPLEVGPEAFRAVRKRVKQRHRKDVCWRVLYRTIATDDTMLSMAYGRDTVTITIHHNAQLPYEEYFGDMEPILQEYGGRPHWGKKHSMKAGKLRELYPEWESFLQIRNRFDPHGVFLSPYLKELLGV
ncbi:oxidoreductase, FAD-binding [Chitinispirillum alkaliphilum]|nr:oxidoreductase, FAD-binding [Chitinispirillum alkaliphilum]